MNAVSGREDAQLIASSATSEQRCCKCDWLKIAILSTAPAATSFSTGIYGNIGACSDDSKAHTTALAIIGCVTGVFAIISSCLFCCSNPSHEGTLKGIGMTVGMIGLGFSIAAAVKLGDC